MKIIADENIPAVHDYFADLGEIVQLPGRQIKASDVKDADLLLVRAVTPVNATLLANSRIKFVGTATAGIDHLDIDWLQANGIAYASAKGCNAVAVAEYVVACVAALQQENYFSDKQLTAGVVGVGHVGSQVAAKLRLLGFSVKLNDPLRAAQEPGFTSIPLEQLADCDLICLHTPLSTTGSYPTFHLIEKNFLQQLKPNAVLLNAGRGAVINSTDLCRYGGHLQWCFDVWEDEPYLHREILQKTAIATPHIAGYTYEAKLRGTEMIYQSAQKVLQLPITRTVNSSLPNIIHQLHPTMTAWRDVVLEVYNPLFDSTYTQDVLLNSSTIAADFDLLRKHHNQRHEFNHFLLSTRNTELTNCAILKGLGFRFGKSGA